jgi:NADH-quinone oxidoreductase subunit L
MENYPGLVTAIILIPLVGFLINMFWGYRFGEKIAGAIGSVAALLSFGVAILLYLYLVNSNYAAAVVNPPILDRWIEMAGGTLSIPWQMRVDTLSVTMMLVVTGIGSMIHIYAIGYMHGDPRFSRFFSYLNLFLFFMLILVTGNNFLMMFVGWEGVGVCSFLLIGFWFDKTNGVGWKNSLAARKAMILNRVGDFGLLMAIFLMFWTFGTLDYFRPGEIANVEWAAGGSEHGGEAAEEGHSASAAGASVAMAEGRSRQQPVQQEGGEGHGGEEEGGHGATEPALPVYTDNEHIETNQLGVFGQAERMLEEQHEVDMGPFSLPIETVLVLITLFMLLGAAGKSAQIPLFVWLPDAMAGPTPVSALIHAATMVTAGVYMIVRSNVFFYEAQLSSFIVTIVGVSTALAAGYMAMGQWDIKRVLAYSTISQLGFMIAAAGIGAYAAAMFHLVTHAFFKALLFLGSGSVIHGVEHGHHLAHERAHGGHGHGHDSHDAHGHDDHADDHAHHDDFDPQDMRNMGGLAERMPITFITYMIGTLALAGIFPFAGFWSKDEILLDGYLVGFFGDKGPLYNLGGFIALGGLLVAAGFTAFYMWRQIQMVFFGQPRSEAADHAPESNILMCIPLIVLAVLSVFGGFFNTPANVLGLDAIFGAHVFTDFLKPSVLHAHVADFNPFLAIAALGVAIGAIILAHRIYAGSKAVTATNTDPLYENPATRRVWSFAHARMYWDQFYGALLEQPFNRSSKFLADKLDWAFWHDYIHNTVIYKGFHAVGQLLSKPVDLGIIDGIVNAVGALVRGVANWGRGLQTGYVRTYAVTLLLGVVLVIVLLILPALTQAR